MADNALTRLSVAGQMVAGVVAAAVILGVFWWQLYSPMLEEETTKSNELSALQADLSRRAFYDGDTGTDQFALALRQVNDWGRARNARIQWVYDWQDAYYWAAYPTGATPAHTQFGADPTVAGQVLTNWPATLQVLIYAAGTWVRGNADVINLDTVYDSTLLSQNKATQLFSEQGILTAKTCFDSRVYTIGGVNVGPTGQTFCCVANPVVTP